ncbi:MAG TPA: transporter substrate-binding domain-containing protein [bacterium]|nr:transporter substrate-binding domain-containing protein [bacterium]
MAFAVVVLIVPVVSPQAQPASQAVPAPVLAGCEIDYPPYCIVQSDGTATGFSVDLMTAALAAVGRTVTFKTGEWAQIKEDLAEGRLQALPLVARTREREARYDFTFPYLTMHGTIVVRNDTLGIQGPEDLQGKRVAVLHGDNAEEYLVRANLGAVIEPRDSFDTALQELSTGGCDAVVIQKFLALQLIQEARLTNLVTVGPPLFAQNLCFATRKGDSRLLADLNEGLSITLADGTFRRLYASWFSPIENAGRSLTRLRIGGTSDNPPYEYLDQNGQPAGLFVDMTKAIVARTGLSADIRLGNRHEVTEQLQRGEIDVVQGMMYQAERDGQLSFSVASMQVPYAIVTRKGFPPPRGLKELSGKSILVPSDSVMQGPLAKLGYGSQLIAVPSPLDALQMLAQGHYDCAIVKYATAQFWIKAKGWKDLQVGQQSVFSAEACFAVSRGHADLLATIEEGLASLKGSDEWRQMQFRWLSPYETAASARRIATLLFWLIAPLLVMLAASLLWSRTLQKKVAQRTEELLGQIAAEQKLEQEYAELNEQLEQRVLERTSQLEASNKELEAFTYSVSHDLRAPLRAIDGYAHLFAETYGEQFDAEAERIYGVIRRNVHSMQQLIDDLLAFSRANRAEMCMGMINMQMIVATVFEELTSPEDRKRILIKIDPLPMTKGDEPLMRQVWANLVSNALKFTSKTEQAAIHVSSRQEGTSIIFSIQDNGAGFDMRYVNKLFGVFQRLHSQSEFEGTGVGLAIVQRLVQRHGGTVWAEGEPGIGATFHFSLPV